MANMTCEIQSLYCIPAVAEEKERYSETPPSVRALPSIQAGETVSPEKGNLWNVGCYPVLHYR